MKTLWYILGIAGIGLILYFVIGWLASLFTIVALTIAIFVAFTFLKKRL